MNIKSIINYVTHTPHNTNEAVLTQLLKQLIITYGGNVDENGDPEEKPNEIVYDGGIEQ